MSIQCIITEIAECGDHLELVVTIQRPYINAPYDEGNLKEMERFRHQVNEQYQIDCLSCGAVQLTPLPSYRETQLMNLDQSIEFLKKKEEEEDPL